MKVNQIVDEHKKGVRAHKYTKKPVNPSAIHAKAKEKLQAIKPMEDASAPTPSTVQPQAPAGQEVEGTVISQDDTTMTVQMPDGTQVKKDIIGAITKDAQGNPVFQAGQAPQAPGTAPNTQQNTQQRLTPGSKIAVNTQPQQQTMGAPARPMGESADNILLDKMLTIAGLR